MKNKYAVIGLGLLGTQIAKTLSERGSEVLAIDSDFNKVEDIKDDVAHAVALDSTDIKALKSQNIDEMDAVVVAIGHHFEALVLTSALMKELGIPRIIARASNKHQRMILEKIGITEIFAPDEEVGKSVAELLLNPSVKSCLPLPDDYEIIEILTPKKVVNKSLAEINLRSKFNLNLITVKRQYIEVINGDPVKVEHIIGVPTGDSVLLDSDIIILFGKSFDVNKFIELNN